MEKTVREKIIDYLADTFVMPPPKISLEDLSTKKDIENAKIMQDMIDWNYKNELG